jgi:hypothetical protein
MPTFGPWSKRVRLADENTIEFGHEVIRLRASLRAAFRLERRHGGFDKIIQAITDGHLGVMADVVRESSGTDLLDCIGSLPLRDAIARLAEPLSLHILALAGADGEASNATPGAERVPFSEYFPMLFRLATGWCGMSPSEAWAATPAEITEAYKGRRELLNAMFGGGKATDETNDAESRRELNAIGDLDNVYV